MIKKMKALRQKMNLSGFSLISLNFFDKDIEKSWNNIRTKRHGRFLIICLFFVLFLTLVHYLTKDYEKQHNLLKGLLPLSTIMIISVFSMFLLKWRPRYSENIIFVIVGVSVIWMIERTDDHEEISALNTGYQIGSGIQLFLSLMIIGKIKWGKNLLMIIFSNCYAGFYLLKYEKNEKDSYRIWMNTLCNIILFTSIAYFFERNERKLFSKLYRKENSFTFFKDLVKDCFPNPIIISLGEGDIVFANKAVQSSFGCKANEEIREFLDKVKLDHFEYEQNKTMFSSIFSDSEIRGTNMRTDLRLFSEFSDNIITEDTRRLTYKEMTVLDMLASRVEFQRPQLPFLLKMRGILQSSCADDNNEIVCYDIKAKNIIWEGKVALILIFSENKSYQKIKDLKEIASYKDRTFANLSHNLRTPLNGIIGLISENIPNVSEKKAQENFKLALHSSQHLLSTINDILDFHMIMNNQFKLKIERFSIWELLEEVSESLILKLELKGLQMTLNNLTNMETSKLMIKSDRSRIKQILLNLALNSLKFTDEGSISITLENPKDEGAEQGVCSKYLIKVKDTGCGISEENQGSLFTLFGNQESNFSENADSKASTGIGLGLTLSQMLVRILNRNSEQGKIKVFSEVHQGSCLSFPLLKNMEVELEENVQTFSSLQIREVYENKQGFSFLKKGECSEKDCNHERNEVNVLIVDDDQINIIVATSYLKAKIFKIDIAHNGLEAFNKIKSEAEKQKFYDIVLMDCNMPLMNGYQSTELIRNLVSSGTIPDVSIIACTANASQSEYDLCFSSGMNDYLSKPFSKKDLLSKIRTQLGKKNCFSLKLDK